MPRGGTGAEALALAWGRRCGSAFSSEARAAGLRGQEACGPALRFALRRPGTPFSAYPPPRDHGRWIQDKPALDLERPREPRFGRCPRAGLREPPEHSGT